MLIFLIIAGLMLISSGIKGTEHALFSQLVSDMTGTDGFFEWAAALGLVGATGYIPGARKISLMLMVLILLVIILANGGVFTQLQNTISTVLNATPSNSPLEQDQPLPSSGNAQNSGSAGSGGSSSSGSSGNPLTTAGNIAGAVNAVTNPISSILSIFGF